jgi:hypothetical protein
LEINPGISSSASETLERRCATNSGKSIACTVFCDDLLACQPCLFILGRLDGNSEKCCSVCMDD